jgi:hypothetical protein
MDGKGDHHAKWYKPDRDSYMWILDLKKSVTWAYKSDCLMEDERQGEVERRGWWGDEYDWSTFKWSPLKLFLLYYKAIAIKTAW